MQSQTEVGSKESIDLTMELIPVQLGLQVSNSAGKLGAINEIGSRE